MKVQAHKAHSEISTSVVKQKNIKDINCDVAMPKIDVTSSADEPSKVGPILRASFVIDDENERAKVDDFDHVEESLRNALRLSGPHQTSKTETDTKLSKSTTSKFQPYVTVFEKEKLANFQSVPNLTEVFLQHSMKQSPFKTSQTAVPPFPTDTNQDMRSNVDDLKRYCSLLTERIKKVEEQNKELVKLAEKQKMEYDRVVAQVVESEQSQRLLIHECHDLRKQVKQLADHNKKLLEQQNCNEAVQAPSFQENLRLSNITLESDSSLDPLAKALKQLKPNSADPFQKCNLSNMAAALELVAALQMVANNAKNSVSNGSKSPNKPKHHSSNQELSVIPESPVEPALPPTQQGKTDKVLFPVQEVSERKAVTRKSTDAQKLTFSSYRRSLSNSLYSEEDNFKSSKKPATHSNASTNVTPSYTKMAHDVMQRRSVNRDQDSSSTPTEKQRSSSPVIDLECDQKNISNATNQIQNSHNQFFELPASSKSFFSDQNEKTGSNTSQQAPSVARKTTKPTYPERRYRSSSSLYDTNVENSDVFKQNADHHVTNTTTSQEMEQLSSVTSSDELDSDFAKETSFDFVSYSSETSEKNAASEGLNNDSSITQSGNVDVSNRATMRQSETHDDEKVSENSDFEMSLEECLDELCETCDKMIAMTSPSDDVRNDSGCYTPKNSFLEEDDRPKNSSDKLNKAKPLKPVRSQLKKKISAEPLVPEKTTSQQDTVQAVEFSNSEFLQSKCRDPSGKIEQSSSHRTKDIIKQFTEPDKGLQKRRSLEIPKKVRVFTKKPPQIVVKPDPNPQDSVMSQSKTTFYSPKKTTFGTKHASEIEEKKTNNQTQSSQVSNQVHKEASSSAVVQNEIEVNETPQKQSKVKLSKRSKSGPLSGESKKSGSGSGNQSKSLVNIMKAKFTRSPSIKSLQGKKGDAEPKRSNASLVSQLASNGNRSSLSIENDYLPPGKDGDCIRKQTHLQHHLSLDSISPGNFMESKRPDSRRVSEEILSDEGFADSSTIERSETEESQLPEDIESLRSKMFVLPKSSDKNSTVSSTDSESSAKDVKQQSWLAEKQHKSCFPPSQNTTRFDEAEMCDTEVCHEFAPTFPHPNEPFTTEVTLVPSAMLQNPGISLIQPSRPTSKKLQKTPSGNALGRFMKNVSIHHSSKDDLSRNKDNLNQVKEFKKNKLSHYQRNIEQAFMSSIVQAELAQGLTEREDPCEPISETRELPFCANSTKVDSSIETDSSLDSIPAVGSCSNSSDAIEPFDKSLNQKTDKTRRNVPNKVFGFGYGQNASSKSCSIAETPKKKSNILAKDQGPEFIGSDVEADEFEVMKPHPESRLDKSFHLEKGAPRSSMLSRNSPMSRSSKLVSPNAAGVSVKSTNLQPQQNKIPSRNLAAVYNSPDSKTKLAPLNYGFARERAASNPINMKSAKNFPADTKLKPTSFQPSQRGLNPSIKAPIVRSSGKSHSSDPVKSRTNISSGLQHPRPVYSSVWAG